MYPYKILLFLSIIFIIIGRPKKEKGQWWAFRKVRPIKFENGIEIVLSFYLNDSVSILHIFFHAFFHSSVLLFQTHILLFSLRLCLVSKKSGVGLIWIVFSFFFFSFWLAKKMKENEVKWVLDLCLISLFETMFWYFLFDFV